MKRLIFTAIVLAVVTIGCTKSNLVAVPQAQNTPITFSTYNGRTPVTKATEVTQDNIQTLGFHVTAFNNALGTYDYAEEYLDRNVSWSSSANEAQGGWTYSPLVYWPVSGTLQFVAYGSNIQTAQTGEGVLIPDSEAPYSKFTYTVPSTASAHKDLVVCNKDQAVTEGSKVTINLKHILTRIGFKLKTIGSGTTVKINNITLYGKFAKTGTVDLINSDVIAPVADAVTTSFSLFADGQSFTTSEGNQTVDIFNNSALTEESTNEEIAAAAADRYMMIIPGDVADYAWADDETITLELPAEIADDPFIHIDYELAGVQKDAFLPLLDKSGANWSFAAGKAYEFIFEVSISQITFTGVVEKWNPEDGEDVNMN